MHMVIRRDMRHRTLPLFRLFEQAPSSFWTQRLCLELFSAPPTMEKETQTIVRRTPKLFGDLATLRRLLRHSPPQQAYLFVSRSSPGPTVPRLHAKIPTHAIANPQRVVTSRRDVEHTAFHTSSQARGGGGGGGASAARPSSGGRTAV